MNHYLAVLSALVILPFALQAKPLSGSPVASGFVRFTGAITTRPAPSLIRMNSLSPTASVK